MKIPTLSFKRIIPFFLLFTIFYLIFTIPKVSAQTYSPNPYLEANTNSDVPKNLHTTTQTFIIEMMSAISCQLAGIDPANPDQKCLGIDSNTGKIGFVENGGGAIGVMSSMISVLYTPPIHASDYINHLASNFGFSKKAYAQTTGTGFNKLKPIMPLWLKFRDIVFLLFVLFLVIIGIAIMLRLKIDPRTVMTIENQIPKIIIGIVLVTFSFAIAGLLIDLMFVFIHIVFNLFLDLSSGTTGTTDSIINAQQHLAGDSILGIFNDMFGFLNIGWSTSSGMSSLIMDVVGGPLGGFIGFQVPFTNWRPFDTLMSMIVFIIVIIALLWAMFRVWFILIMAYINILLDVVLAPFWIVTGVLPGGGLGFGGWLKDIVSNLAAFPTVVVLLLTGKTFMDQFSTGGADVFQAPMIGNLTNQQGGVSALSALIGFGTILLAPKALDYVKAALKAPKFDFTPIKSAVGMGTGTMTGTGKEAMGSGAAYFFGDPYHPGVTGWGAVKSRLLRKGP